MDDMRITLDQDMRDLRTACREWLNMSFTTDAMDRLLDNQAQVLIDGTTIHEELGAGIIYMPEIQMADPIISESDFAPRRSLMSRYAMVQPNISASYITLDFEVTPFGSSENNE